MFYWFQRFAASAFGHVQPALRDTTMISASPYSTLKRPGRRQRVIATGWTSVRAGRSSWPKQEIRQHPQNLLLSAIVCTFSVNYCILNWDPYNLWDCNLGCVIIFLLLIDRKYLLTDVHREVWIGGKSNARNHPFYWLSDVRDVDTNLFSPGEPNETKKMHSCLCHGLPMSGRTRFLGDNPCDAKNAVGCQAVQICWGKRVWRVLDSWAPVKSKLF